MRKPLMLLMLSMAMLASAASKSKAPVQNKSLRAPAVPLITSDPFFSVWSAGDKLNDVNTSHWTGRPQPLIGAIRVDGTTYRFLGKEELSLTTLLPMSTETRWNASFTETKPADEWMNPNFNDNSWKTGKGAFGTERDRRTTLWESTDIWVRRTFELKEDLSANKIFVQFTHDDACEIYINGVKVVDTGDATGRDVLVELDAKLKSALKPGINVIAAHCNNSRGGGILDFGLYKKNEPKADFSNKAEQLSVNILPTQTVTSFKCGPVQLDLTFTAPLLMEDLDLISTPINYISYQVRSLDKKKHDVQVYFETTPQLAVNTINEPIRSEKVKVNDLTLLKTGTIDQPILNQTGDDMRINWGYLYLGGKLSNQESLSLGDLYDMKESFITNGKLRESADPKSLSSNMKEKMTVLAYSNNLGTVSTEAVKGHLMIGYDDINSIRYFYEDLMPYWKHNGKVDIYQAFEKAGQSYESLIARCSAFDVQMMKDAEKAGGKEYASLCALAYRQAIAAHKLVQDKNGNLLFLSKENNSGGFINTVDVTYPSAPLFLLYNPELLKGMLNPIFNYSESGRWNKPYPAHDLGGYPIANGQHYGEDMPIEEGGNMLLLATAISNVEGNADYARKHWDVMSVWVDYLLKEGLDPENQLCTDDFAGHLAHNTNLSIKAIMAIAGYGKMAEMLGKNDVAKKYTDAAKEMAIKWEAMANNHDHYRLTFDQPDTWSQKYNLVWDKIFNMGIFPQSVAEKEIAFYLTKQNPFGLPLDSRKTYTKSDWIMWTACLANNPADFQKLISPIYKYVNETPSRVPLCDWHETTDGKMVGFKARSVVGGYFMKMLEVKVKASASK